MNDKEVAGKVSKQSMADSLPSWVEGSGGRQRWNKWVNSQVKRCDGRAKKWLKKRRSRRQKPSRKDWRMAILLAIATCDGRGHYSKLPLTLNHSDGPTHSMWPSVEHLKDPATAEVALETRLVNDMATIMNEAEFVKMLAHLSVVMNIRPNLLTDDWHPMRSFSAKQDEEEPPLPSEA
jgi:hypothetical protein